MSGKSSPFVVDLTDDDDPVQVQNTSKIIVTPQSKVYKKVSLKKSDQSGQPSVTRIGPSGVGQPTKQTLPMLQKMGKPQKPLIQTLNTSGQVGRPPPLHKITLTEENSTQKMGTAGQTKPMIQRVALKTPSGGVPLKLTPITSDSQLRELISKNKVSDNQMMKIVRVLDTKAKTETVHVVNKIKSENPELLDLDQEIKRNAISKVQPKVEKISPKQTLKLTGEKYEVIKQKSANKLIQIKIEDSDDSNGASANSPPVGDTVVISPNSDKAKLITKSLDSSNTKEEVEDKNNIEKIIFVIGQDGDSQVVADYSANDKVFVINDNPAQIVGSEDKTPKNTQVPTVKFTVDKTLQPTASNRNPYIDLVNRTLGITEAEAKKQQFYQTPTITNVESTKKPVKTYSIYKDVQANNTILNKYLFVENQLGKNSKENNRKTEQNLNEPVFGTNVSYPTNLSDVIETEVNSGPCTNPNCISFLDPKSANIGEPIFENPDIIFLKRLLKIPKPTKKDLDSIVLNDTTEEENRMLQNLERNNLHVFLRNTLDDGKHIYVKKNLVVADVFKSRHNSKKYNHPKFVKDVHLSSDVTAPDAFKLLRDHIERNVNLVKQREIELEELTKRNESLENKIDDLERTQEILLSKRYILEKRKRNENFESKTISAKYPRNDQTENGFLDYAEENSMENIEDMNTENEDFYTENLLENISEQLTEDDCIIVSQEEIVAAQDSIGMPLLDDLTVTSTDSQDFKGFNVPLGTVECENVTDDNVDMDLVLESQEAIVALAQELKTMQ